MMTEERLLDERLSAVVAGAAEAVTTLVPTLEGQVGICVGVQTEAGWRWGSFAGAQQFYPASVVKIFFAGYWAHLVATGALESDEEDERALADMLGQSGNESTGYLVDRITGTTGGPNLNSAELEGWMRARQAVNLWLIERGYGGVNTCQKTWNEGPWGRERQGYGPHFELRNRCGVEAATQFFGLDLPERVKGYCVRDLETRDNQTAGFLGEATALRWGADRARHWSKAGFAYEVRHDVARVDVEGVGRFALGAFTDLHRERADLIPQIGLLLWEGLADAGYIR